MKEKKIKTQVSLMGKALEIVLSEQKKYKEGDTVRGKSKVINQLLTELYDIKNIKPTK